MNRCLLPTLFLALGMGGCVAPSEPSPIDITSSSYLRAPRANTAPRGSEEFCRIYGQQTADNRMRFSTQLGGGGPSGSDRIQAQREGERAIARCRTGRLN